MAIITDGAGTNNDPANEGPSFCFALLDFLRTNSSWTIAGSGDGSASGGMATDAIDTQAKLQTSTSWFVLQDPDSTVQILFGRNGTNDTSWDLYINPDADYAGGSATVKPTNAGGNATQLNSSNLIDTGTSRFHLLCDDGVATANAGWAIYSHTSGSFTSIDGGLAFVPLLNGPAGDTHPFVFLYGTGTNGIFTASYLYGEGATLNAGRSVGVIPGSAAIQTISAGRIYTSSECAPNSVGQDTLGNDFMLPIPFLRRSAASAPNGFKGVSDFVRWNGVTRAAGETLDSLNRISLGDVNLPWDGVSIPTVS